MTRPAPVFVSDGDERPALAATRSLGRAGVPVHVLAARPRSLAGVSRHAAAEHVVPSAARAPERWSAAVAALLEGHPGALLLPVGEVAMGSAYRTGLPDRFRVACPPEAAYEAAVDKQGILDAARASGLPVPRSVAVARPHELEKLPGGLAYPVVVKSRWSRWYEGGRWRAGSGRTVRNDPELAAAARAVGGGAPVVVQEFVPGSGEGLFVLCRRGAVIARFAHRRLREKPPSGGVATLCESVEPDPALADGAERLLHDLGWDGVAMLEFRRRPDGRAALLELNPRLWGSLALAVAAGVDFPRLLVALARGEPLPPVAPRAGVRVRWLLGDVDHVIAAARSGAARPALAGFLRSFADGTRCDVLRWRDLRPFARELGRWLRREEPVT